MTQLPQNHTMCYNKLKPELISALARVRTWVSNLAGRCNIHYTTRAYINSGFLIKKRPLISQLGDPIAGHHSNYRGVGHKAFYSPKPNGDIKRRIDVLVFKACTLILSYLNPKPMWITQNARI